MTGAIENLVFEAGGVKAIAYAGAIAVLEQRGLIGGVRGVAGTSAGALTAMMLALGCSAAEIKAFIRGTDFPALEDHFNPLRIATRYGLFAGDALLAWIASAITGRGHPAELTFAGLARLGGRELRVYACDLDLRDAREFSVRATPDATVAGAVRASMSIPLMYAAWQFPGGVPDDHLYVDGGTVLRYPIAAFDTAAAANPATLGFHLVAPAPAMPRDPLTWDHPTAYGHALFECLLYAQEADLLQSPAMLSRTVPIDDLGFSSTNMHLTDADYARLYDSGRTAVERHFAAPGAHA
jgi:NTE family protein